MILAAATSSRCLKTTFRTSLRRFTHFLFGCSSIAWKFTGRPYLETHEHTWSSPGRGHTFPLCPSPSSASGHTSWLCTISVVVCCLHIRKHFLFEAESQLNSIFVFYFPLNAPKECFFINFVCHLFCGHFCCLLWASGVWCVRVVPSREGTIPGRELYVLTSAGNSVGTACLSTYLRTDSTKTLKAFTWIQATNASLKFTFSQRSKGPCENRHNPYCDPLAVWSSSIAATTEVIVGCWDNSQAAS